MRHPCGVKRSRRRTAVSWSGGKDSALALWKAKSGGLSVEYLLNTVRCESDRVAFHGVRSGLIKKQADLLELPLLQKRVGDDDYKERFLEALDELANKGITTVVFGDIDVEQNRAWCESVCREAGIEPYFPLWSRDQRGLIREFIDSGFKAVVVAVDSSYFDKSVLGTSLDDAWLGLIEGKRSSGTSLTYCGENGEYHTFVTSGPNFKSRIKLLETRKSIRDGFGQLDVVRFEVAPRRS